MTLDTHCTLFWNQGNNQITTPLGKQDNAPAFQMAPGFTKFSAFCAECSADLAMDVQEPVHIDDIDNKDVDSKIICQQAVETTKFFNHNSCGCTTKSHSEDSEGAEHLVAWCALMSNMFKLNDKLPEGAKEHIKCNQDNLAAELLTCHHKFGHVSFQQPHLMAKARVTPK